MQADISSKESIDKLYQEISQREPEGIHLLVNNAGIAGEGSTYKDSFDHSDGRSPRCHDQSMQLLIPA